MKHYLSLAIVLFTVVLAGCKSKEEKTKFTFACDKTEIKDDEEVTIKATVEKKNKSAKWHVTVTNKDGSALAAGALTAGKNDEKFEVDTTKATFKFGAEGVYKVTCKAVDPAEGEEKSFEITIKK